MNADREIYLSEQVTAFKVKVSQIYQGVDYHSRFKLRAVLVLKFIYSEKATKFCEIFPLLLTAVHTVKSKGKISQNFVAFSEYMNFKQINGNNLLSYLDIYFDVNRLICPLSLIFVK